MQNNGIHCSCHTALYFGRQFGGNEIEWTRKAEIKSEFLVAGEACTDIYILWPAPGFKEKTFGSGFLAEGTVVPASAVTFCMVTKGCIWGLEDCWMLFLLKYPSATVQLLHSVHRSWVVLLCWPGGALHVSAAWGPVQHVTLPVALHGGGHPAGRLQGVSFAALIWSQTYYPLC